MYWNKDFGGWKSKYFFGKKLGKFFTESENVSDNRGKSETGGKCIIASEGWTHLDISSKSTAFKRFFERWVFSFNLNASEMLYVYMVWKLFHALCSEAHQAGTVANSCGRPRELGRSRGSHAENAGQRISYLQLRRPLFCSNGEGYSLSLLLVLQLARLVHSRW